jgi:hypothetical protein
MFGMLMLVSCGGEKDLTGGEQIYAAYEEEILACDEVCKFASWYFVNAKVLVRGDQIRSLNKAKLLGLEKAYYFIFHPDLYEQIYHQRVTSTKNIRLETKKVQTVVVNVAKESLGGKRFLLVTLGVKPK